MANRRRGGGNQGMLSRYLAPRMWAGGWIVAVGICICVIFNLASRHGVLAPEAAGKQVKQTVRPVYGVASSAGSAGKTAQPAPAAHARGGAPRHAKKDELPIAASAVVLVRNNPTATPGIQSTAVEAPKTEPEGPAHLTVITLAEATKYNESRSAIFVDARSAQRFAMGHVPGALNVPSSDFDKGFERNGPRLPRDAKIVVYCESASCDQAEEVANKLLEKGYRKVMHFKDGWLVWEFSDQVQEKGGEQ